MGKGKHVSAAFIAMLTVSTAFLGMATPGAAAEETAPLESWSITQEERDAFIALYMDVFVHGTVPLNETPGLYPEWPHEAEMSLISDLFTAILAHNDTTRAFFDPVIAGPRLGLSSPADPLVGYDGSAITSDTIFAVYRGLFKNLIFHREAFYEKVRTLGDRMEEDILAAANQTVEPEPVTENATADPIREGIALDAIGQWVGPTLDYTQPERILPGEPRLVDLMLDIAEPETTWPDMTPPVIEGETRIFDVPDMPPFPPLSVPPVAVPPSPPAPTIVVSPEAPETDDMLTRDPASPFNAVPRARWDEPGFQLPLGDLTRFLATSVHLDPDSILALLLGLADDAQDTAHTIVGPIERFPELAVPMQELDANARIVTDALGPIDLDTLRRLDVPEIPPEVLALLDAVLEDANETVVEPLTRRAAYAGRINDGNFTGVWGQPVLVDADADDQPDFVVLLRAEATADPGTPLLEADRAVRQTAVLRVQALRPATDRATADALAATLDLLPPQERERAERAIAEFPAEIAPEPIVVRGPGVNASIPLPSTPLPPLPGSDNVTGPADENLTHTLPPGIRSFHLQVAFHDVQTSTPIAYDVNATHGLTDVEIALERADLAVATRTTAPSGGYALLAAALDADGNATHVLRVEGDGPPRLLRAALDADLVADQLSLDTRTLGVLGALGNIRVLGAVQDADALLTAEIFNGSGPLAPTLLEIDGDAIHLETLEGQRIEATAQRSSGSSSAYEHRGILLASAPSTLDVDMSAGEIDARLSDAHHDLAFTFADVVDGAQTETMWVEAQGAGRSMRVSFEAGASFRLAGDAFADQVRAVAATTPDVATLRDLDMNAFYLRPDVAAVALRAAKSASFLPTGLAGGSDATSPSYTLAMIRSVETPFLLDADRGDSSTRLFLSNMPAGTSFDLGPGGLTIGSTGLIANATGSFRRMVNGNDTVLNMTVLGLNGTLSASATGASTRLTLQPLPGSGARLDVAHLAGSDLVVDGQRIFERHNVSTTVNHLLANATEAGTFYSGTLIGAVYEAADDLKGITAALTPLGGKLELALRLPGDLCQTLGRGATFMRLCLSNVPDRVRLSWSLDAGATEPRPSITYQAEGRQELRKIREIVFTIAAKSLRIDFGISDLPETISIVFLPGGLRVLTSSRIKRIGTTVWLRGSGGQDLTMGAEIVDLPTNMTFSWDQQSFDLDIGADTVGERHIGLIHAFVSIPNVSVDLKITEFPPSRFAWGDGWLQAGPKPGHAIGSIDLVVHASTLTFDVRTTQMPGIGATWNGPSGTFSLDGELAKVDVGFAVKDVLATSLNISSVPPFDLSWDLDGFDLDMDGAIGSLKFRFASEPLHVSLTALEIPAVEATWDEAGGTLGTGSAFGLLDLDIVVADVVQLVFVLQDVAPLDVAWSADALRLVPAQIDPERSLIGSLVLGVVTEPFRLNVTARDIPGIVATWAGDTGAITTTGELGSFEVRALAQLDDVNVSGALRDVDVDVVLGLRGVSRLGATWDGEGFALAAADPAEQGNIGDEVRVELTVGADSEVLFLLHVRATRVPGLVVSSALESAVETFGELGSLTVTMHVEEILALQLTLESVAPMTLAWDDAGFAALPRAGVGDGTLMGSFVLTFRLDLERLGFPIPGQGSAPAPKHFSLGIVAADVPGIEATFGDDGRLRTTGTLRELNLLLKLDGLLDVLFLTKHFPALEATWDPERFDIGLDGDRIGSIVFTLQVPPIELKTSLVAAGVPGLTIDMKPDDASGVTLGDYAPQMVGDALGAVGLAGPLDRILFSVEVTSAFRAFLVLDRAQPLAASWNGTSVSVLPTGAGRNDCGILCGLTVAVITEATVPIIGKLVLMVSAEELPGVTVDLGGAQQLHIETASELGLLNVLVSKPGDVRVGEQLLGRDLVLRLQIRDVDALTITADATEIVVAPESGSAVGLVDVSLKILDPWVPPQVLEGIAGVLAHKSMTAAQYDALVAPSSLSLSARLEGVPGASISWGQGGFHATTTDELNRIAIDATLGQIVSLHVGIVGVPALDINVTGRSIDISMGNDQIQSILVSFKSVDMGATLSASDVPGLEVVWDGDSGTLTTEAPLGHIQLAVNVGHAERFGIPGLSGKVNLVTRIAAAPITTIAWDLVASRLTFDTGQSSIGTLMLDFSALDIRAQLTVSGIPTTTFDWSDGAFSMSAPAGIGSIRARLAKGTPVFSIPFGSHDHLSLYLRPNQGVYGIDMDIQGLRGITLATDSVAQAERLTLQFVEDKDFEIRLDAEARLGPTGLGLTAEDVWLRAEAAVLLTGLPATMRFTFGPEGVTWDGRAADGGEPQARIQADVKLGLIQGSDTTAYSRLRTPWWPFHNASPQGAQDGITLNALADLDKNAFIAKMRVNTILPLDARILLSPDGAVPGFHATTGTEDGLGLVDLRIRTITPVSAAHGIPVLDATAFVFVSNIPSSVRVTTSLENGEPGVTIDSAQPIDRVFVGLRFDGNLYPPTDVDAVGETVLVDSGATLNNLLADGVDQLFGTSHARRHSIDAAGFALFLIVEDIPVHVALGFGRSADGGDMHVPFLTYEAAAPTLDLTAHVDIEQIWKRFGRTAVKAASDAGKLPSELAWLGTVAGYEVWGHATLVVVDVPTGGLSLRQEPGLILPKVVIEPVGGTPLKRAFLDFEFRVGERKSTSGTIPIGVSGFELKVAYDAGFQWDVGVESLTVLVEDLNYLSLELGYAFHIEIDGHLQFGFLAGVGLSAWARVTVSLHVDVLFIDEEMELFTLSVPEFRITALIDPGFIVVPWITAGGSFSIDVGLDEWGVGYSYEYPDVSSTLTGAVYGTILGPHQGLDVQSPPGQRQSFDAYLNPKIALCYGGTACAPGIPLLPQAWVIFYILATSIGRFVNSIEVWTL